ncbi:hypothetical protein SAMN05216184_11441 [Georgenia satyanarayanai]|uniref:Uncharacterized protein n=1 Tax=Georgenia satyanarayanai TaxID=860221 RepID=A0A2Y9AN78_9MICO|nr:hypothetical protein [Georgenia satyanarayanai]PYF97776.1 hypothetical protein A8987_11441 [Georgenia satyanarayanai]SSA45516.1 hypothetical protein SAMN05216184_11441 [Georgenia satyanarayanai]
MISASAWSSRWAAGTAALLLAGGSALPGDDLQPPETDPAPPVGAPTEETPEPEVPEQPDRDDPTDGPTDGGPAVPPADGPSVDEPPAEEPPLDELPVEEPPAEDGPDEEPPAEDGPTEEAPEEEAPSEETEPVGPVLVVVPEPVRGVVDGAPGYVLPLGDGGFTWLVDGVRVDELGAAARLVESPGGGWYELSAAALGADVERLVLAVVAAPGHALLAPDGTTSLVRAVLDPRAPSALVAPTALDGEGREDAVVVPEATTQVVRDAAGEVLDAGIHPVTAEYVDGEATVTLTVTAAEGHRLEVGGLPVEAVPGAGGPVEVVLVLTDVPPATAEPAPSPEEPPAPAVAEAPAEVPARDPAEESGGHLALAAPLVTVPPAAPEPAAEDVDVMEPVEALAELPESGPEGLGLMVMLGGLLLGGSWLALGMRGE